MSTSDLFLSKRAEILPPVSDVVSFLSSKAGLGIDLFPVQFFILKMLYGLPLEANNKTITIRDRFNENDLYFFTEEEYLKFLYEEGRINRKDQDGRPFREMLLLGGRKGSKTTLSAMLTTYELYRLLSIPSPAEHYNLLPSTEIRVTNVANSKDQASLAFGMIKANLTDIPFLKRLIKREPGNVVEMLTQRDMEKHGKEAVSRISVFSGGCNSRTLRGPANFVVILDELAHFMTNDGVRSDGQVYAALTPSTASFGMDGKIISITSPLNREGKVHEIYEFGMDPENYDIRTLVIQVPTWELNPNIDSSFLREEQRKDPIIYECEYGAQFSERVSAWIENEEILRNAAKKDTIFQIKGVYRTSYFSGIDLGVKNDSASVAIVHKEDKRVILDVCESFKAGIPPFENQDIIKISQVADRIKVLSRSFNLVAGIYDQWNGYGLQEDLEERSLKQFNMVYFNETLNSEIYSLWGRLLRESLFEMPDEDEELIHKILRLKKTVKSGYKIKVEGPGGRGDDEADAIARAIWCAFDPNLKRKDATLLISSVKGQYGLNKILNQKRGVYIDERPGKPTRTTGSGLPAGFRPR